MPDPHWEDLKEIFHAAIALAPEKRGAYLDGACDGDASLRQAVESLIKSHEETGFVDQPAYQAAADLLMQDHKPGPGQTVGRYHIVSLIGEGGMGRVYLAEDSKLHRKVSLKFLSTSLTEDQERLRRFEQEARAASALNHPNIITIHEIGAEDGHQYIVTEFIEARTLRERLGSPLDLDEALDIAIQVASALVAAHRVNIIHRDIKPENIMIRTEDGLVKVLDFGLAKVSAPRVGSTKSVDHEVGTLLRANTAPGVVMGTVAYMSPEQARGEIVDERTDIWSLGVVLYEMVAGCSPFVAGTSNEIISAILSKEGPPPLARNSRVVPERLEEIVEKALTKNKDERYQTSKDLLIDLKRLRQTLQLKAVSERTLLDRIAPAVSQASGANSDSKAQVTQPISSAEYIVNQVRGHKRSVFIGMALLLLIATAALIYGWRSRQTAVSSQPAIKSLAVLPLENLSGDPSQEYFADGMTDELITEIAKLGDVQVISRSSVMRFKNSKTPVPEIARQLDVDAVLTGSVLRVGDRARITVQLIHAATDRHVWAESYERDLKDVLLLQRDIASNVGQQISARVAVQQGLATRARQIDPAAHEAYLKGLYYSNKSTPNDKTEALRNFTEATRISPFYPEAYANIADCYLSLGGWYAVHDRDEALTKARAAVTEALRQDETLADTHVVLGYLRQEFEWDWNAAEREFRRAVALNPSNATAHIALARHLLLVGRLDEVPAQVERARIADPLALPDVGLGAWILEYSGQHQDAVDRMKTVVKMDPNIPVTQFQLGLVYMDGGELDEAADQFRTSIRMYPAFGKFKAHLAFVLARSGDKQQARKLLDELMQSHNIVSFDVGLVMAGLGEQEQAIDWLEKAYQERSMEMVHLRVLATPNAYERPFYFLRPNRRFKELIRRMNFSEL